MTMTRDEPINVPLDLVQEEACANCRFSRLMNAPPFFRELPKTEPHSFCLRMPPSLVAGSDARGFARWGAYPPTQDRGWCGEWLPKPGSAS